MKLKDFEGLQPGTLLKTTKLEYSYGNDLMYAAHEQGIPVILKEVSNPGLGAAEDTGQRIRAVIQSMPENHTTYLELNEAWWYAPSDLELYEDTKDDQFLRNLY